MITCKNGIAFCYHNNNNIDIYGSLEEEFYINDPKETATINNFIDLIDQYITTHEKKHLIMKADILSENVVLFRLFVKTHFRTEKICVIDETNYVPFQISKNNIEKLLNRLK